MTGEPAAERYACPSCGGPVWPGDNFCEACRADLSPVLVSGDGDVAAKACPTCPGAPVTTEGYCESCGRKLPSAADHAELTLGLVAGVTDRGLRHRRNEDAMALATAHTPDGPVAIAVVCDGVSTASLADEAARAAAGTAMHALITAVRSGGDPAEASVTAFGAAKDALIAMAASAPAAAANAPSATYVS